MTCGNTFLKTKSVALLCVTLIACGGSGTNKDTVDNVTIKGSVFAAPVSGATVVVRDTGGNTIAGPVSSGVDGQYTVQLSLTDLQKELTFEADGGTYEDEATQETTSAGLLSALVLSGELATGVQVHITPESTIIGNLVKLHDKTPVEALTLFKNAFGYEPTFKTAPSHALVSNELASETEKLAGLRAAAFSQLTKDLGLSAENQFDLLEALVSDLSDGLLDGLAEGEPVSLGATNLSADIQNRFNQALLNFRASGHDRSALSNSQIGVLPFAKVALTESYRVQYIEGTMKAMQGKTDFSLNITDHEGVAKPGLSLMVMPVMNMAAHSHSTPIDNLIDRGDGIYDISLYYLMASTMQNGTMGYWDLKITIGEMMTENEAVHFYPTVMMAMGDTARATLKGQAGDKIAKMNSQSMPHSGTMRMSSMGEESVETEQRTYYLFNDGCSGDDDSHTCELFIATKENMMSYPALVEGGVLNQGSDYEMSIDSVTVALSLNAEQWVDAIDKGDGHWSASNITGFINEEPAALYVQLSVNGELKTTDGEPATEETNRAIFPKVTPSLTNNANH